MLANFIRKTFFWLVACVLVGAFMGSVVAWVKSYERSDQVVLRVSTPGVSVLTSDRGRVGWLMLGHRPMGERWVFEHRINEQPAETTPRLDQLCLDNALGFGMDQLVTVSPYEQPAVAGVLPAGPDGTTWAPRRFVVPYWAISALAFGTWIVWLLWYGVPVYRAARGACRRCAFDLKGCSHFCPKCGKAIPRKTWSGETRPKRRPRSTA